MRKLLTVLCFAPVGTGFSQAPISLDSCIAWSKNNYPLIKQNEVTLQQTEQNEKSIRENWLPKLSFMGQATYNTEVVQFDFPGMNLKFPHDAYLTSLSLEQNIYDGGQTKSQHSVEKLNTELTVQQNEAELYKLVERVNQLYVNILLGRENLHILELYKEDLENSAKNMRAGVNNGLVLASSLDELEAEILKTDQNIIESKFQLEGLYKTLTLFTGKTIDEKTEFSEIPIGGSAARIEIQRPEMKIFDLQSKLLDAHYKQINVNAIPKVTVGAAGNYGRPGPNFINQNLRFFGSANLTIRWNISSLYGLKREKTKVELNKNLIDIQKEVFLFNIESSLNTQTAQLNALAQMIEKDDIIIGKRQNVTATATSQMENGKITVVDYLSQLNAELQAKLNKKVHEIKRMNAISTINATSGSIKF
ncbi:TolC family protein [Fluviicola sp.]|jgi:outer membrane protein TolC|uniref:TolC family protein n=1 Tax=Fluviicola sp. TaxID=1917219 RepID=UPI002825B7F8|nr:TolC family protein [Fluviicola sp.]MDR0802135.1 TolC family protein [Fluviicola sp.]